MNILELVLSIIVMSLVSFLVIKKHRYAIHSFFWMCFLYTFAFNPIAVGGYGFIKDNPLSREMIKINDDMGNKTSWLVYGDYTLSNLPRMIGLKSFGGTHFYPQLDTWRVLDPKSLYIQQYNRYSYVDFLPPKEKRSIYIESPQADIVRVYIDPSREEFRKLGVTHVLVAGDNSFFNNTKKFEKLFTYAGKNIYKIKY